MCLENNKREYGKKEEEYCQTLLFLSDLNDNFLPLKKIKKHEVIYSSGGTLRWEILVFINLFILNLLMFASSCSPNFFLKSHDLFKFYKINKASFNSKNKNHKIIIDDQNYFVIQFIQNNFLDLSECNIFYSKTTIGIDSSC